VAEPFVQQGGWEQQREVERLSAAAAAIDPLSTRASWTVGLLIAGIVSAVAGILAGLYQRSLLSDVLAGETVSVPTGEAADVLYGVIGLIQFSIFVATAIAFLMWFQMAYSSLPSLGALALPYKPWLAAGAWFIPFFSLVGPKQMADAVYRAGDPSLPRQPGVEWKTLRVNPLLHLWWAAWIVSMLILWLPFGAVVISVEQLIEQVDRYMWADAAAIIAGGLALAVVMLLTKRLTQRAKALLN
jgi:hypothetical protein